MMAHACPLFSGLPTTTFSELFDVVLASRVFSRARRGPASEHLNVTWNIMEPFFGIRSCSFNVFYVFSCCLMFVTMFNVFLECLLMPIRVFKCF